MAELASVVLGSASPQRAALLASLGIGFEVEWVDLDETALVVADDPDGTASAGRIARAKFDALSALDASSPPSPEPPPVLLTADTVVVLGSTILGKPSCDAAVRDMLAQASGRRLVISTGLCVGRRGEEPKASAVSTVVELRTISADEREAYVHSGAGLAKAGGLALQSAARPFVTSVNGCWSNVIGLPLCAVASALAPWLRGVWVDDPAGSTFECSVEMCGSCWRQ